MKKWRRSLRQAEILIHLEGRPAKTITDLAERMDALRPSVSRSLRTLKEQGLVYRDRNGWHLTEAGETEVAEVKTSMVAGLEKLQTTAKHLNQVWGRMDAFSNLIENASQKARWLDKLAHPEMENVSRTVEALGKLAHPEMENVSRTVEALGKLARPAMESALQTMEIPKANRLAMESTIEKLGNTLNPLLEAQRHNGTLMSQVATSARWAGIAEITRQNNLLMAGALDNVLAIHQAEMSKFQAEVSKSVYKAVSSIDFDWVSAQLASVTQPYEHLVRHQLEHLDPAHMPPPWPQLTERYTVPTVAVVNYTDSLRDLVEAETGMNISPLPDQGFGEFGDQSLDPLLNELNPDFVEIRHGSWVALHNGGPDRLRHASTSQRELLTQVLQALVPDFQLPEDSRQGPQIKARVRQALEVSASDAEFIEGVTKAVYVTYRQLNKYTHHNKKHEESLIALLRTVEGLLRFILAQMNIRRN